MAYKRTASEKKEERDAETTSPKGTPAGPRFRNASATREAILQAARVAFAQDSYERVGVREIAAAARVDAALVNRYFGSKGQLFLESVKAQASLGTLLTGDRAGWGEQLVRSVLQGEHTEGGANYLLILLRSSGNEPAGALLRREVDSGLVRPLAALLPGENALLRAGLIVTYLTGFLVMISMIGSESLAQADPESLVALAAPVLQSYIDGFPRE